MTDNQIRQKKRRIANKIWAINKKGGKCIKCGEDNIWKLVFHHIDTNEKDFSISKILDRGYTRQVLENEINKCELLCNNCHKKEHFYNTENLRAFNFKKICLDYKQKENFHCEHPEHFKNINNNVDNFSILEFHHIDPKSDKDEEKKLFELSKKSDRTYKFGLNDDVKKEIDKCIVYCGNCHNYEHQKQNIIFYNKYKDEINYLSDNYTSLGSKLEQSINKSKIVEYIKKMHNTGLVKKDIINNIIEIFPHLKKDTIWSYYESEYPNEKRLFKDRDYIINQLKSGKSTKDLSNEFGYKSDRYIRKIIPDFKKYKHVATFEKFCKKFL